MIVINSIIIPSIKGNPAQIKTNIPF